MSGLDNILTQIINDAQTAASTRVSRAEKEAQAILVRKQEEAAQEVSELLAAEKAALDLLAAKSRSSAESESKKRLLEERVALIDEVLAIARTRAMSLSPSENEQMIERFVRSHASELTDDCQLILNARDLSSISDDFSKRIARISVGIRISDRPGDFEAGCILRCGPIEYNGTVDAIIYEHLDEIRDLINRHLFS
ncbi:MAG: V-type ATP synthase subunit E [Oscillospiraceae bacterium]|jgi:V/A-type H+-transporting ATPase subunit E|nr:V-type ATP synthase subunit E [Oscillospiraceae bacterium]